MEFSGVNQESQSFILLINVKMSSIVGILTFMSRINFMLSQTAALSMKKVILPRARFSCIKAHLCFSFITHAVDHVL